MARIKGSLLQGTFDSSKRFPVDARMLVNTREDLINPSIWQVNTLDVNSLFDGLITAVNKDADNNGVYYLLDKTLITQANYTSYIEAANKGDNVDQYFVMWKKLCTLDEINLLSARVFSLEQKNGITQEELTEQLDVLKNELIQAGYITANDLLSIKTELQEAIDTKADNSELQALSQRVSDFENIAIINGGTAFS